MVFAQLAFAIGIYLDKFLMGVTSEAHEEEHSIGAMLIFGALFNILITVISLFVLITQHGVTGGIAHIAFDLSDILSALAVGVMGVLWVIPYLYALHFADESTAPPVFQSVPIFGFFLGFFFFGEIPSTLHILAGSIIIAGALVLNLELIHEESEHRHISFNKKAFGLMLIASFIIALSAFMFKDAASAQNYWGTTFWMSLGTFFSGICMWALITPYGTQFNTLVTSRNWKFLAMNALNETSDQIAMLAFYGAMLLGPSTALVQSTGAYQPLLLLIIGYILAKNGSKRHTHILTSRELIRRTIGVLAIVFGSVLIFV